MSPRHDSQPGPPEAIADSTQKSSTATRKPRQFLLDGAAPPGEMPLIILPDDILLELQGTQRAAPESPRSELDHVPEVFVETFDDILPAGGQRLVSTATETATDRPAESEESEEDYEDYDDYEADASSEEDEPFLEQVEIELDEELQLDEAARRQVFAMPRLCVAIVCLAVVGLSILLIAGWPYYGLAMAARPLHHFHNYLRPSGPVGLSMGIAGTCLMVVSLLYLLRKRYPSWNRLGPLRAWMGFHIFTGLMGPALIVFHAAFIPSSALGMIAFFAMLIVVSTGLIGRYLYAYVPRSLEGRELEFEDVRRRLAVYRKKLVELGVRQSLLDLDPNQKSSGRTPRLLAAVARVVWGDRQSRREYKRLREVVHADKELRIQTHRILLLVRKICREKQWLVRYNELHKLMGAWRFLHRWLAIILFVLIFYHVTIGVRFGDMWIFNILSPGGSH